MSDGAEAAVTASSLHESLIAATATMLKAGDTIDRLAAENKSLRTAHAIEKNEADELARSRRMLQENVDNLIIRNNMLRDAITEIGEYAVWERWEETDRLNAITEVVKRFADGDAT